MGVSLNTGKTAAAKAPKAAVADEKIVAPKSVSAEDANIAEATVPEIDPELLGSKSDSIEFVATLGDASRKDTSKRDGKEIVRPAAVGYLLRFTEDTENVPDFGLSADAQKNLMSYGDLGKTINVKAGTEVGLTRFETAALLSRPEYNGRIGGGISVNYGTKGTKTHTGDVATAANSISTIALVGTPSLKEREYVEVVINGGKEEGGVRIKREANPAFPKFAVLATKSSRRSSTAGTSAPAKDVVNERAAAFQKFVAAEKAKATSK